MNSVRHEKIKEKTFAVFVCPVCGREIKEPVESRI